MTTIFDTLYDKVAASTMKKMTVWDIDDTLLLSNSKIQVFELQSPRSRGKTFTPTEWNDVHLRYSNKKNYMIDYGEFRDSTILTQSKIIKKTHEELLKRKRNSFVLFLTARENLNDVKIVKDYFNKTIGVGIANQHRNAYLARAGEYQKKLGISGPKAKAHVISNCLERKKFDQVDMWDDHNENLIEVGRVVRQHKIRWEPHLIQIETTKANK